MWFILLVKIWNLHRWILVRLMLFYHFVLAGGWLIIQYSHWIRLNGLVEIYNISVELKLILTMSNMINMFYTEDSVIFCLFLDKYKYFPNIFQSLLMNLNRNIYLAVHMMPYFHMDFSCFKICTNDWHTFLWYNVTEAVLYLLANPLC